METQKSNGNIKKCTVLSGVGPGLRIFNQLMSHFGGSSGSGLLIPLFSFFLFYFYFSYYYFFNET